MTSQPAPVWTRCAARARPSPRTRPVQQTAGQRLFVVVGGGRWARVYLSVMATFDFPYRVAVVSAANATALAGLQAGTGGTVRVLPSLDALPRDGSLAAGLVVNAAGNHADTTARLIALGASVLVEKPIALHPASLADVFAKATGSGLLVMPALTFLHCAYLENFARVLHDQQAGRPVDIDLVWHDPVSEQRYGEEKSYDPATSIAQDVMPHVWSVLAMTMRRPELPLDDVACEIDRGGRSACFTLSAGGLPCRIDLQRDAPARRRTLVLNLSSGTSLALDFTQEPGTITHGIRQASADPGWAHALRPVRRQLQAFLDQMKQPTAPALWQRVAECCTQWVDSSDAALKRAQLAMLQACPLSRLDADVAYAFGEVAGEALRRQAPVIAAGNRAAWFEHRDRLLHRLQAAQAVPDWYSAVRSLGLYPQGHVTPPTKLAP